MKRLLSPVAIIIMVTIMFGQAFAGGDAKSNPISDHFNEIFSRDLSQMEMNDYSSMEALAWKAEFENACARLKELLQYDEDKAVVEKYKKSVIDGADAEMRLEMFRWDSLEEPPKNRRYGTGLVQGAGNAVTSVYKPACLNIVDLIENCCETEYKWIFKPENSGN